jgi:hypothetical protein
MLVPIGTVALSAIKAFVVALRISAAYVVEKLVVLILVGAIPPI